MNDKTFERGRTALAALFLIFAAGASTAAHAADKTTVRGGGGGQPFDFTVPGFLIGFNMWQGDWVDRFQPVFADVTADGQIGKAKVNAGLAAGGSGGSLKKMRCGAASVLVGLRLSERKDPPDIIGNIEPVCENLLTGIRKTIGTGWRFPEAESKKNPLNVNKPTWPKFAEWYHSFEGPDFQCARGSAAIGIYGGAYDAVDRIGLICAPLPAAAPSPDTNAADNGAPAPAPAPAPVPADRNSAAYCRAYADEALIQAKQAQQAGCNLQGGRYSTNYNEHVHWCLHVKKSDSERERDARRQEIEACGAAAAPSQPAINAESAACDAYAQDAVTDIVTAKQRCNMPAEPRFTTSYQEHFKWCMAVGSAKTGGEQQARKAALQPCL